MVWLSFCHNRVSTFLKESDDEERRERQKKEAIKKREEEVQRSLSSSLRERDKERDQHKRDEAVQHFKALLADLVILFFVYHFAHYAKIFYIKKHQEDRY